MTYTVYILLYYLPNNALPFNQPWGALNYKIYSGGTVYIYIGALSNFCNDYTLKKLVT